MWRGSVVSIHLARAAGGATLRGVGLCQPCKHLVDVMGIMGFLPTLIHRGGLHAQVLGGGTIGAIEEA